MARLQPVHAWHRLEPATPAHSTTPRHASTHTDAPSTLRLALAQLRRQRVGIIGQRRLLAAAAAGRRWGLALAQLGSDALLRAHTAGKAGRWGDVARSAGWLRSVAARGQAPRASERASGHACLARQPSSPIPAALCGCAVRTPQPHLQAPLLGQLPLVLLPPVLYARHQVELRAGREGGRQPRRCEARCSQAARALQHGRDPHTQAACSASSQPSPRHLNPSTLPPP